MFQLILLKIRKISGLTTAVANVTYQVTIHAAGHTS